MDPTDYDIKDTELAEAGRRRIEWALSEMPVMARLIGRFKEERPLEGMQVGACLHVTAETANLVGVLKAGGAEVALCASNPLSTQDDVAAALVRHFGVSTYAIKGEGTETYYRHLQRVLDRKPVLTLDDGADLTGELHKTRRELLDDVIGGTEETTTGVTRLRAMAAAGVLEYPIIAVNDAKSKHLFDNRYGTGQSTLDGILRATNILLAGRTFTVVGYGWCGRGVAARARGAGANVIVSEVSPLRALEALMDGFRVLPLVEAARQSDVIVTVTGDRYVVDELHFAAMKDGCVLANSGHFNVEINIGALEALAQEKTHPRPYLDEYRLRDGRRIRLLAEGRLVNLAAGEGHPSAVMDMSFGNQALSVRYLARHGRELSKRVYRVPDDIDDRVAREKLAGLRVTIDSLSEAQANYLSSWREGT